MLKPSAGKPTTAFLLGGPGDVVKRGSGKVTKVTIPAAGAISDPTRNSKPLTGAFSEAAAPRKDSALEVSGQRHTPLPGRAQLTTAAF